MHIDEAVADYLVRIVRGTREHSGVQLGASPRAAISLTAAAKANAFLNERDYIIPDDIKSLASSVLAHRMMLHTESRLNGLTTEDVIELVVRRDERARTDGAIKLMLTLRTTAMRWRVIGILYVISLLFLLFQGGKTSFMLFCIFNVLVIYLVFGRWSGIGNVTGTRRLINGTTITGSRHCLPAPGLR